MTTSRSDSSLRDQVMVSCREFLRYALSLAKKHFGSGVVPMCDVEVEVMEPTEPGRWSGKRFIHQDVDTWRIFHFERSTLATTTEWAKARDAIQNYVNANNIQPIGFQFQDVEALYLVPLFRIYLRKVDRIVFRKRDADRVARQLLNHLDSPAPEVKGLIVLEDFSAARAFRPDPKIEIRPIAQEELVDLGRTDQLIGPGLGRGEHVPRTDWWICEVILPNPRGTAVGFNSMHDMSDMLALAFRAFKSGGLSVGFATSQVVAPFGRMGQVRGGRLDRISVGGGRYSLSSAEITAFTRFWRKFKSSMEQDHHYLQVPIRRLRSAGTRAQQEDALVDYVVGLEALLGTEDERTELSYRFRIRGSVLLAKRRSERRSHLRILGDLYDLRSRIVHGQIVSHERLEEALPKAENALRVVWKWYFDNWADQPDNRVGIERIDSLLVGV